MAKPEIAILAGEASGDAFGAELAREIVSLEPGCTFWGLGGDQMREAGVQVIADTRQWASIGVIQALRAVPVLRFVVLPRLLRELRQRPPSVVVPIDFGAFNVWVARWCKAHNLPVLYYLPPGSWRREGPPQTGLAAVTDRIATQFPWSEGRLRDAGADAVFVGHPLLDIARPRASRAAFVEPLGLDSGRPMVALLPGSRRAELVHNASAMAEAARIVHRAHPDVQFVVALAGGCPIRPEALDAMTGERDGSGRPWVSVVMRQTHDALAHCVAAVVCSGTATLEAAILGVPMVIIYRGSRLMAVEYAMRRIARIEHIGLPNIVAGRRIVPELVADGATADAMAAHVLRYIEEPGLADAARRNLDEVRRLLGEPGAARRTAEMVLHMVGGRAGDRSATGVRA